MLSRSLAILAALAFGTICASLAHGGAPPEDPTPQHDEAQSPPTEGEYSLVYKFAAGDLFRTEVTHAVTVETRLQGNTQTAQSRSLSTKAWEITEVDDEGNITLVLTIENIEMWQSVTGREPVSYNSRTDENPPLEYEQAASTIGKPLATVTIDRHGRQVEREDPEGSQQIDTLGFGKLAVPLPEDNVKVGEFWDMPGEVRVRMPDTQVRAIQIRQRYELTAVEDDVATIQIRTEVISPVNDPGVKSQLVQQLQHGEVKFDIEAGRLISKEMELDEMVIGFQGANSMMKYLSHYSEEALPAAGEALPAAGSTASSASEEATSEGEETAIADGEPASSEEPRTAALPEDSPPSSGETESSAGSDSGDSSSPRVGRSRGRFRRG